MIDEKGEIILSKIWQLHWDSDDITPTKMYKVQYVVVSLVNRNSEET